MFEIVMDFFAKNMCHMPKDMLVMIYCVLTMEIRLKVGSLDGGTWG